MVYSLVQAYGYFNARTGEFKHRIQWPGEALTNTGEFQVQNLHIYHPQFEEAVLQADLVILHFLHQDEILHLIRLRAERGKPTLYEIPDNFLSLGSFADATSSLRDPNLRANCFNYARLCQGLQFTTQELVERFGFLNRQQAVFANQLPNKPPPRKKRSGRFVFGWGGSHSHSDDLAFMAEAVTTFCARHPDAVFAYMGHQGNFDKYFGAIPPSQKRFHPFGPMEDYEAFIHTLHVGICVVAPTGFSACRSDCKYLEYAQGGATPVLSNHPIYHDHGDGKRGLLFNDSPQLLEILEQLYEQDHQCEEIAQAAHAYAASRVHSLAVEGRLTFYRNFLQGEGRALPTYQPSNTALKHILDLAPLMQNGQNEQALAALNALLTEFPDHGYGRFCRIKVQYLLGEPYWDALLHTPESEIPTLYADRVYEIFFSIARKKGNNPMAQKFLGAISDPVRRGWLAQDGEVPQARFYRNILQENPYDFNALTGLARHLSERRHVGEEAEQLAIRACLILPEAGELHQLLAKIRQARNRPKRRR